VRALIDYRPALRERSGVGEYTHQLVRALTASARDRRLPGDLELSIFSSSWRDRLALSPELAGVDAIDRKVPVAVLNFAWHRLGWPAAETLMRRAFDVTHSLHPLLLPSRDAAQVVTIHDLNFLDHPERTRAEIRRDYPGLAAEHANRADCIIVPSRFTAGEVERRLRIAAAKIDVCPPGAPEWPARTADPRDGYVLFFGTLEPRKNLGGLLDAYERLAMRRSGQVPELLIAGKALAGAEAALARLSRPPLRGIARHVGYVDPAHRRELYLGARLLVQPSFEEGFGMPVLEAMTVGVPVVAARRGALPEVLGDSGPLVDPDDPDAIAGAIARILDDGDFANAAAARGVRRATAFTWLDTAQRVYACYARAIAHRQRCGSE
jgi:glycosyltransferase involved in cell wall biosynthesis